MSFWRKDWKWTKFVRDGHHGFQERKEDKGIGIDGVLASSTPWGEQFLDKTVTTDETMINLFDPETKRESSVWKRTSSTSPLKARVSKSVECVMFIFFMDGRGMLLVHAVPEGQTVNASFYHKVRFRFSTCLIFYIIHNHCISCTLNRLCCKYAHIFSGS